MAFIEPSADYDLCAIDTCLTQAEGMARLTMQLNREANPLPEDDPLHIGLPLCDRHQQLTLYGIASFTFAHGLE